MRFRNLFFILILLFFNLSCRDKYLINLENLDSSLKKAINIYYGLEKMQDWERTYSFRPKSFRDSVPKETYLKYMRQDNSGWKLINYRVLEIKKQDFGTVAKIKFTEQSKSHGLFNIIENTHWIKREGEWFCSDCGVRTHLSLNALLVEDYDQ
jgi:hypothetical protein